VTVENSLRPLEWILHGGVGSVLVLGRKPGEYVMIGDDIMVKVVRGSKGDLRLAIRAPQSVKIVRGEVYEGQTGKVVPAAEEEGPNSH